MLLSYSLLLYSFLCLLEVKSWRLCCVNDPKLNHWLWITMHHTVTRQLLNRLVSSYNNDKYAKEENSANSYLMIYHCLNDIFLRITHNADSRNKSNWILSNILQITVFTLLHEYTLYQIIEGLVWVLIHCHVAESSYCLTQGGSVANITRTLSKQLGANQTLEWNYPRLLHQEKHYSC